MAEQPDRDELRIAVHKYVAARLRFYAARHDAAVACIKATRSMRRLVEAMTAADAREVAQHPDLAEMNVMLDGFYAGEMRDG